MQVFNFVDGMFVDGALMDAFVATVTNSFQNTLQGIVTPGFLNPAALTYTFNNSLIVGITAPSTFQLINAAGQQATATGTINGASSNVYSLNFASLIPGSGSVTAYIVASIVQIGQSPITVVGPPKGHPDYNPANGPFVSYTVEQNSIAFTTTTTAPDNVTYFEVARVTLTSGQTAVTALNTSDQLYARPSQAVPAFSGNPNGNLSGVAGNPFTGIQPSMVWDTADNILWVCTTTGTSSTAVWKPSDVGSFPSSLGTTGWKKYPDPNSPTGYFIEQWAVTNSYAFAASEGSGQIGLNATWPIPFPNAVLTGGISSIYPSLTNLGVFYCVGFLTTNSANIAVNNTFTSGQNIYATVWAKGY